MALKALRDDIAHAKRSQAHSGADWEHTIFARLLEDDDLASHAPAVHDAMEHYLAQPRG